MSKKLLMNTNENAQDNYRRYYQEVEGTFITATDKSEDDIIDTSRFIEVAEIWGNTVQDENNLEDIQSIGELYVDEQGQPILDDLGREQYKVVIDSCNKNLLNLNLYPFVNGMTYNYATGNKMTGRNNMTTSDMIPIYPSVKYHVNGFTEDKSIVNEVSCFFFDSNKKYISRTVKAKSDSHFFTTPSNAKFMSITLASNNQTYIDGSKTYLGFGDSLYTGDYIPHQSHKTTILLPCQLQKVGDVYDRLYWDSEKGRYVIEKNIGKYIDDGTLPTSVVATWESGDYRVLGYKDKNIKLNSNAISTLSKTIIATHSSVTEIQSRFGIDHKYRNYTIKDFNDLAKINNIIYYVPINTPQLIETNITEKILLPCYEEKTHIFVNSTVDATMKVLVPYKEII